MEAKEAPAMVGSPWNKTELHFGALCPAQQFSALNTGITWGALKTPLLELHLHQRDPGGSLF